MKMSTREENYNFLRGQLDSLGYNQSLPLDSLPLVTAVLSDLALYKDRFVRYKDIAQNALQKTTELEYVVCPLQEENDHLRKENNFLHLEILQTREQFEKNLKGLRHHISDLESAYSDLEFANMEQMTKIGALEEQILNQNEKLFKYEGLHKNMINKSSHHSVSNRDASEKSKKSEPSHHSVLPNISSVNNYISDILSHKSPQEWAKEVEKLKVERKKLSDSINFYQKQILSRDEEIKRLSQRNVKTIPAASLVPACRCHFLDLDIDLLAETDFDVRSKCEEMSKKLQSSVQTTVKLAEQIKLLERRLEKQMRSAESSPPKQDDFICICREIEKLQDLHNMCHCHSRKVNFHRSAHSQSQGHDSLLELLREVTSENEGLKREVERYKNKVTQDSSFDYKQLLRENNSLRRDCCNLSEQLQLALKESNTLKESNLSFQKIIEDLRKNKKSPSTKSVSAMTTDLPLCKPPEETISQKKGGSDPRSRIFSAKSGSNQEKVEKSKTRDFTKDFANLKNDIIKEVESVCKQYIPAKPDLAKENEEKLDLLGKELEKMKAERDYYCKEYHCLQDKISSSNDYRDHNLQRDGDKGKQESSEKNASEQREDLASLHNQIGRLIQENEFYRDRINLLEEKIKSHDAEKGLHFRQHDHEKDRSDFSSENRRLHNEISSLRQQLMELQHEIHYEKCESKMHKLKLEDTVKFLEIEKSKSLSKTEELISKIQYLEGTINSLNKKIQDLLSENSCLQSQYSNLRSVNEHLERSLKNADAACQKCENELSEAFRQLKLLEQEKIELGRSQSSAKLEAQSANEKIFVISKEKDSLMEKLDAKTVEVCRLEKENSRQYCLINQLEEKISRLNCQLIRNTNEENKAESEISHLKRELEICTEAKNKLFNENRNLNSDLASLVKDNEIKFNENEKYKGEILKLKEQLQNYVEEVRRAEQILEAKELEREEMLEQFKTLSAEAMNLENNYQTLESEKKWASTSLRAAQEKLQDLQATVENKDSLVSGLEDQIMELSNELFSLRNELSSVQGENSRLKHDLDSSKELITSIDSKKKKYESDIQNLEKKVYKVTHGIEQTSSEKEMLSSQVEAQQEVISTLERAVSSSRKEAMQQSLENQSILQKVDELQATVNQLQDKLSTMNGALLKYQEMCDEYKNKNLQLQHEIINEKFEKVKAEETQSFSTSL